MNLSNGRVGGSDLYRNAQAWPGCEAFPHLSLILTLPFPKVMGHAAHDGGGEK